MWPRPDAPRVLTSCAAILTLLASVTSSGPEADASGAPSDSRYFLVVCSPGSPGTTLQAQPTMDSLARAAARAAGWPEDRLGAGYYETTETGLERLARPDAALALVPPAFLAEYGDKLALKPRLEALLASGGRETWSLVAGKGKIASPGSLKGWEVTGAPGFAPDFVRDTLFKGWGKLPSSARVTFTARPLSALRRASAGEAVAVLLDDAGARALPSLPFAGELEVAARSAPLPGALLCTVGSRMPDGEVQALVRGLSGLDRREGGPELLKSLRLARFAPLGEETAKGRSGKRPAGAPPR